MNKLIQEIIKPILENNPNIKKIVGIYGGRFQPFGPHHYKTYKWLQSKVDEAYISTSNIKKPPRHPMNFKEKVRHMTKMGVKANRIIEEKTPYVAKNLQKKFNKDTTAFVYVFGAKDAGRLGGSGKYYKDFKKNKNNLVGYEEHGYYLTAPHVSISVGGKEVSGTTMRELLGSNKYDDKERAKLFKDMFGYFNQGVFNMMVNKFKKLFKESADMEFKPKSMHYVPSRKKKLKSKFKDGKGKELIKGWLEEGVPSKVKKVLGKYIPNNIIANNAKLIAFISKNPMLINQLLRLATEGKLEEDIAMGYPNKEDMKKIKKKVKKARDTSDSDEKYQYHPVKEDVKLPIKVGDTIMMGRFKNKKVVIKDIDFNDKGDLMINGRPALKFRIMKEFYESLTDLIKESTASAGVGADDGPSSYYGNYKSYRKRGDKQAEKLGYKVINYIMKSETKKDKTYRNYPDGPVKAVSFLPSGIGTGRTPNNQENLTGAKGYNKWKKHITKVAQTVGMKLINFLDKEDEELVKKDSVQTIKKQKEDEKKIQESLFTKQWWKENLLEGKKEFVIWGIPPKKKSEEILFTKAKSMGAAKQVLNILVKSHGVKKARIQVLDLEQDPSKFWKSDNMFEGLITEGGAYGHMAHPFDDKDLTFGDLKKIIELGLGGQLNREDNVTEKLDGQNIMISWKDGKLIAARNKGHIKNGGKTALDGKGIASKFKGRGSIRNAFVYAMRDLEKAIKSLSDKQKDKIFNNGYNFMNLEVMYPSSANVIDYDVTELIFHGALKYDDNAKVIGEVPGSGRMLQGMIKQRNQNIQKKYSIGKPVFLDVPKHQDFGKMKGKFLGKLNKLQAQYGLKDNDTLALYHQMWWEHKIYQTFGMKNLSGKLVQGLTKRWAFFDKSYSIANIKKDWERFRSANPKRKDVLQAILDFDKNNHAKQVKENMRPFEILFFEVGAEILKNVKGFISANPKKSVRGMIKRLDKAISDVKSGGDIKKLNRLKTQLDRLNAIGGTKAIVPSEGLVFKYKGKTYKFTGAFAPVNQIAGLINF